MDAVARSFDSQSEAMLLGFRSTIMANTVPKVAMQPPSPAAGNQRRRVEPCRPALVKPGGNCRRRARSGGGQTAGDCGRIGKRALAPNHDNGSDTARWMASMVTLLICPTATAAENAFLNQNHRRTADRT